MDDGSPPRDNWTHAYDFSGATRAWLQKDEFDGPMRGAIVAAIPEGAIHGFNIVGDRVWVCVSAPGDTEEVIREARRALGR